MASDRPPLPPNAYSSILNTGFTTSPFQSFTNSASPTSPVTRQIKKITIGSPISTLSPTKRTSTFSQYSSHITNSPKKPKINIINNSPTSGFQHHHYVLNTNKVNNIFC